MVEPTIVFSVLLGGPLCGAVISLLPKRGIEITASIAAATIATASSLLIVFLDFSGNFSGVFYADGLTRIMTVTISTVFLTSVIYSTFYIKRINEPFIRFRWYYCLLDLFAFTMLLAVTANDLGFIWLSIEATTVTSALLVALERERTSIEAAWRYTLIVSAGLVISLLSVIFVFSSQGTLAFDKLIGMPSKNAVVLSMAMGFALVGYGTKAGIAPMHSWLPDAHSEAPSPISAMFSAVLLPTSLYAFVRTFDLLRNTPTFADLQNLAIGFGIFTSLLAAVIIARQQNYKRMLAYSSMENMGIILVGLALGGVGTLGAIIQLVSHAFAKSSAFYASGNIIVAYNSKKISEVQGIANRLRITGYLFTLSCFSVTGAPPFGVFFGEFLILSQAMQSGNYALAILLAIAYVYAFIGLNRQSVQMVFGQTSRKAREEKDLTVSSSSLSTSSTLPQGSKVQENASIPTGQLRENKISILVPLVNLAISLIIGIYLFPTFLEAASRWMH
jgi:hydrogenase-4 component F